MAEKNLKNISEKELIHGSLKGSRKHQKALFLRYAPTMLTVCRRFASHVLEAEDMLQDGFVIVFTKLDQFQFQGSFEGWIRKIMVHNAIRTKKKQAKQMELPGLEGFDWGESSKILADLSAEEILGYIRDLPEGYRLVFNLFVIEGFSHKEIAEMLDIQEGSSRSQLIKARRSLQEKIIEVNKVAF